MCGLSVVQMLHMVLKFLVGAELYHMMRESFRSRVPVLVQPSSGMRVLWKI
jgi:hypothetical protein